MKARMHIIILCREMEFLTRGAKRLRAAALVQFLARGVIHEGPYAYYMPQNGILYTWC